MRGTRFTTTLAAGAALALGASAALADTPVLQITSPTDGQQVDYDFADAEANTVEVEVRATRDTGGQGGAVANLCGVENLVVTVDDEEIGRENNRLFPTTGANCPTSHDYRYTWDYSHLSPEQFGDFTIEATAVIIQGQNDTDAEPVTVEVVGDQDVTVDAPAAPAVAASLLNDADLTPRYGHGRTGGNHVADTAHEMNNDHATDFRGVAKTAVRDYCHEVAEFLNGKDAPAEVSTATCPSTNQG